MSIRINDWFVAGNAQKTNSDWNATSGFAQILNKPTNLAHTTGNETLAGIKTFSSIPQSVTPATSSNDTSVATTAFVTSKVNQHNNNTSSHNDIRQSVTAVSNSISPAIEDHNTSNTAHNDIRQSVTAVSNSISTAIGTHNTSNTAHSDIRQSVTDVSNSISSSIEDHNISSSSHGDLRQAITQTNANISSAVEGHNGSLTSHSDIRQAVGNNASSILTLTSDLSAETSQRNSDVAYLQEQIDALSSKGDVADIVGTYQDLLNYDTSTLLNKSIIKVLTDSTHDDASSYYKWNTYTSSFTYIGSEAPTYNKTEIDTMDNNTVHKTGNETVGGTKTFTSNIFLKDTGKIGTTTNQWGTMLQFQDCDGTRLARLQPRYISAGTLQIGMYASNGTSSENGIWVRNNGETSAPTPTEDTTSSTQIDTVGARNTKLQSYPLDTSVVHKTGNETIAGTKTFSSGIQINSDGAITQKLQNYVNGTPPSTDSYPNTIVVNDKNGAYFGFYGPQMLTNGTYSIRMGVRSQTNSSQYSIICASVDSNGNRFATAPTPVATNNTVDNYIATTGWVSDTTKSTNVVHRSDDETITGNKTFTATVFNQSSTQYPNAFMHKNTLIPNNYSNPSSAVSSVLTGLYSNAGDYCSYIQSGKSTDGITHLTLNVRNRASSSESNRDGSIGIYINSSGTVYTSAPTPDVNDNSTKIATTAWCSNTSNNLVHKSGNETIAGTKTFSNQISATNGLTSAKELIVTDISPYGQFRAVRGNYGFFIRNDGGSTYFLLTNSGDQLGSWNSYRPLTINNSTGDVTCGTTWTFNQTINGTAYRAYWADLAENYLVDKPYPKGTLVQFGGEKEITIASNKVNAVITSDPGFILNGEMEGSQAIALIGRVPVRVIGKVKKFDKIALSYIDGVGCVSNDSDNYIGISLVNKDDSEEGLILCSVRINL